MYFRSDPVTGTGLFSKNSSNYYRFRFAKDTYVEISGNIMFLLDPTGKQRSLNVPGKNLAYCFNSLFGYSNEGKSVLRAPVLPATTLATACYFMMFYNCTSLSSIEVNHAAWNPISATSRWLYSAGSTVQTEKIFKCPQTLIDNTGSSRNSDTVPISWTMVAKQA